MPVARGAPPTGAPSSGGGWPEPGAPQGIRESDRRSFRPARWKALPMTRSTKPALLSLALALALLAACDSSSGGGASPPIAVVAESEPNDTFDQADALTMTVAGHGEVADDADTDFWSVPLTANEFVSIEVFGNRFDFDTWTANGNAPSIRLFDTDGTTLLMEQSDELLNWTGD